MTVTPLPLNDAARRRGKPAPGSKKPRPPVAADPVTVTATPVCPGATLVGVTDVMAAGGGASSRVSRTAYESVALTYCCSVQSVMSSLGSTLV